MILLGLLSTLVGLVLGMRYRVFILYPAIAFAWVALAAGGFALNESVWSVIGAMLLAGATLQFGFLFGVTTRTLVAAARTPTSRAAEGVHQAAVRYFQRGT